MNQQLIFNFFVVEKCLFKLILLVFFLDLNVFLFVINLLNIYSRLYELLLLSEECIVLFKGPLRFNKAGLCE